MKRSPVEQTRRPAYPDRRGARLVLGLLALGPTLLASAQLAGCSGLTPPAIQGQGVHACPGDMAVPEVEGQPAPEANTATIPDSATIPEAQQVHVLGDVPAPAPPPPVVPEVQPIRTPGEVPAPAPPLPVVPEAQPETEGAPQPPPQPEHHLAGDMPAPVSEPAPPPIPPVEIEPTREQDEED